MCYQKCAAPSHCCAGSRGEREAHEANTSKQNSNADLYLLLQHSQRGLLARNPRRDFPDWGNSVQIDAVSHKRRLPHHKPVLSLRLRLEPLPVLCLFCLSLAPSLSRSLCALKTILLYPFQIRFQKRAHDFHESDQAQQPQDSNCAHEKGAGLIHSGQDPLVINTNLGHNHWLDN